MLRTVCSQGDEIATISIDNPEFEGVTVEEEPVQEESEGEEEEQQSQEPAGVLEGAVETEASAPGVAEGVGEASEAAEAAAEPAPGAEGSEAEGAGNEDAEDDGFVKVCWDACTAQGWYNCLCRPHIAVTCLLAFAHLWAPIEHCIHRLGFSSQQLWCCPLQWQQLVHAKPASNFALSRLAAAHACRRTPLQVTRRRRRPRKRRRPGQLLRPRQQPRQRSAQQPTSGHSRRGSHSSAG